MDSKDEKKLTLEEQYEADKERRLNNTIEFLKQIAEENMDGKEKQDFLDMLPETTTPAEVETAEGGNVELPDM